MSIDSQKGLLFQESVCQANRKSLSLCPLAGHWSCPGEPGFIALPCSVTVPTHQKNVLTRQEHDGIASSLAWLLQQEKRPEAQQHVCTPPVAEGWLIRCRQNLCSF